MFIGRNVFAIHGERGHAVARAQVTEDLVVGAILLDDVDHVPDGVGSRLESNLLLRGLHHICLYHGSRQLLALGIDFG